MTISANSGFVVRAKVDEQDVAHVRAGQPATISGEDLGTTKLPGHVALVGAVAQKSDDPSNTARQVLTTVALDRAVPYLRDGMNVDVDIITLDKPHVLAVPADAVRRDANNKPYVLVVKADRTAKRSVTLGSTSDTQAVITAGLKAGERIVGERNAGIVDQMSVTPTTAPTPSPSPAP
jgi:HlyD family secretion protein